MKRELKELDLPLTWGEVPWYFYYNLQEKGNEKTLARERNLTVFPTLLAAITVFTVMSLL